MSYMYEFVFGPENVAATLRGIHPDYGPQLAVIMQRLSLFNIFQDHPDFLTGYEGISVAGGDNFLSFTLRFVSWKKQLALCISLSPHQNRQSLSVWLENRAGSLRPCNYLDFAEFYKSKGFDFDWTLSGDTFSEDVNRVLSTASKLLSQDLAHYYEGEGWPYLTDTNLRDTTAEEFTNRIDLMGEVNLLDTEDQSLLFHAVKAARPDLVKILLNAGIRREPVLHVAAKLENVDETFIVDILDLLITAGVGPDNFDQSEIRFLGSESPLEIAAIREHMKVVRFLLGNGARRVNPRLDYHPAIRQVLCSALSEFHAQSNSV